MSVTMLVADTVLAEPCDSVVLSDANYKMARWMMEEPSEEHWHPHRLNLQQGRRGRLPKQLNKLLAMVNGVAGS